MKLLLVIAFAGSSLGLLAQDEPNPRTLLPQSTIEQIVNEVSGSLAMNHILELAAYERDRLAEEYRTVYRESAYIEKMAKQYGLEEVKIERFKLNTKTWDGELGELWLMGNSKRLLISYRDVAASLAPGSKTSDVTADLVYVGRGDDKRDYADRGVSGKMVLASGPIGTVHNLAVREFGALGVLSFQNPTGKPIDRPDQIAWNSISRGGFGPPAAVQAKTTFGFNLSHRLGMELVEMLEKRQVVKVRAFVKATEYDADMQVPTVVIKGTGQSQQVLTITGHLFEGIAKQGALDDASGSAATLEVARAWKKLIDDSVLPRPRRTIRFLWVPEIQGTRAYLERYPDETKRMISAISMDMVGEDVTKNRNSLRLMRTPYSVSTFLNDVAQSFFEYVGDTNREKVQNRRVAYAYRFPILDPQGTRDQFAYSIEKHYGSSDHSVFLSMGVPGVLFNNWPDIAYHTSEDRPGNADATQLKRVVFIALATLASIADAHGDGAMRVAELCMGSGAARAGEQLRHALYMIAEKESMREAVNLVRQAYAREAATILSAKILAEDAAAGRKIEEMASTFSATGLAADLERLKQYAAMRGRAADWQSMNNLTKEEQEAASLIPVRLKPAAQQRGGPREGGDAAEASRQQYNAMEMRGFADGTRSVLDIRDALSAEYGAQPVSKVLEFFRGLEKSGEFALRK
ncbi:MAG: M28 family peptidase [Candidatus Solibacter usitatus]|nr:M28 family peptidase [Candidatus Solibacter usitatus]